jgi:phytoene dehydrogenase-like protein
MEERWDVVVVGAGLAGLVAAATAADGGASVLVVDSRDAGGRAATDQVGRFRFNRGAHALYRSGPGPRILARLGITVSAAPPPPSDAHGRLLDGVGLLPWGDEALARTGLVDEADKPALAHVLATMDRWRPADLAERTAGQWFDDLGLPPTARRFLETQARLVTYVVDFDRVSADLVVTQLQQDPVVDYLHGGWARLVDQLTRAGGRRGVTIAPGVKVGQVAPVGHDVRVDANDRVIIARQVVLAAGAPAANARLLPEPPPAWERLGPRLDAAALDLGLDRVPDRRVVLGLDRPLYLSMHAPPADLAPPGGAVVHLLRYLGPDENVPAAVARAELHEHARVAGIEADSIEESRYLHRMVVTGALPLPELGGMAGRPRVTDTGVPGVLVAGDWVGPDGHLADAALASGEDAGRTAAVAAGRAPTTHAVG